jgi:hypothetical protein
VFEEKRGARAKPDGVSTRSDGERRHRVMVRPSATVADSGVSLTRWLGKPLDGLEHSSMPRWSLWI